MKISCHLLNNEAKEKGHLRRHLKTVHKNTLLEMQDGHSAEFDENNEIECKLFREIFPDKYTLIEHRQVKYVTDLNWRVIEEFTQVKKNFFFKI